MITRIAATATVSLALVGVIAPAASATSFGYESKSVTPAPVVNADPAMRSDEANTVTTSVVLTLSLDTRGTFIVKTSECAKGCPVLTHKVTATGKDVDFTVPAGTARFAVGYRAAGQMFMNEWQYVG